MKKSFLLVVIIPAIIFLGSKYTLAPFFSSQQLCTVCDPFISSDYVVSINSTLEKLVHENISAHAMIFQLQEQFSFLKKITIAYQPLAVRVTMFAHKPLCVVNNGWVFTATQIFPKNIFSDEAIAMIPHISIVDDNIHNKFDLVAHLLQRLPSDIYHEYAIELLNEYCFRLIDKKQSHFTIISSIQQTLSPLLTHCDAVKQALSDRGAFNKDNKWIADTRFAHYIVAYRA